MYSYRINVNNSRYHIGFGAAIGEAQTVMTGIDERVALARVVLDLIPTLTPRR